MSEKHPQTTEEKKINRNSFIIGIFIGAAIIALFTVFYYAGLIH